jgi:hypothetical protein
VSKSGHVTYHLYGRTEYSKPLEFVEAVTVAWNEKPGIPEGKVWLELIAFPETAVVQVIPRTKEKTA